MRLAGINLGAQKQARADTKRDAESRQNKKPENSECFRGVNPHIDPHGSCCFYLLLSRLYCRPRNHTESCLLVAAPASQRRNCHCPKRLVGFTTDREFTCYMFGASVTLPRRLLSCVVIISLQGRGSLAPVENLFQLRLDFCSGVFISFKFLAFFGNDWRGSLVGEVAG